MCLTSLKQNDLKLSLLVTQHILHAQYLHVPDTNGFSVAVWVTLDGVLVLRLLVCQLLELWLQHLPFPHTVHSGRDFSEPLFFCVCGGVGVRVERELLCSVGACPETL